MNFKIEKKLKNELGRAGVLTMSHGAVKTPAFVTVGTKATVKAMTPEQVKNLGAQIVLANTYHLYLQPGDELIKKAGGLHSFMNWNGPTMTDSGGFQVFSLGVAFGDSVTKIAREIPLGGKISQSSGRLMKIDEDGVNFCSHIDGSKHRFTPEKSIEIQHNIGADIIFAFDECTSPNADYEYQQEAMERTHRWAKRCLTHHHHLGLRALSGKNGTEQSLFGIVQGGRFEDLRKKSARAISQMDFGGFGIGGSFNKEDMYSTVGWVNQILPEEKPRHMLGIGEPEDLFGGVQNGIDLFDCVSPTRMARNGTLHTQNGRINILNSKFKTDLSPIDANCQCYACQNYTRAYLAHLFRAKEMLAGTLASIHNLYFIVNLVAKIRQSILDDNFFQFKEGFLNRYRQ